MCRAPREVLRSQGARATTAPVEAPPKSKKRERPATPPQPQQAAPIPPNAPLNNDMDAMDIDRPAEGAANAVEQAPEAALDREVADADPAAEPTPKKARTTRKLTAEIFAEFTDAVGKHVYCKLGCLARDNSSRLIYSFSSTASIERHAESKHKFLLENLERCKDNSAHVEELLKKVAALNEDALLRLSKLNKNSIKFNKKALALENKTKSELILLMWSIANGVPRNALNCPILDKFFKCIGSITAENRHDLGGMYLEQLDLLVQREQTKLLAETRFVCPTSDGWRDLARRDWVDLGVTFMIRLPKLFQIAVLDLDLIHVPFGTSGDVLEVLVRESIDERVFFIFINI